MMTLPLRWIPWWGNWQRRLLRTVAVSYTHLDVYKRQDEALRDAAHAPLPLTEWDAVKRGRLPAPAKGRVCYLKTSCTFEEVFQHTDTPPMQLTGRPVSEVVYSRSDYDGYRWWTTWHNVPGKKPAPELVKEIDEFQNALFKLPAFKTLDTMRRFCRYAQATSEATEFNLYSETDHLYCLLYTSGG